MGTLNVRLTDRDVRIVRELKRQGVSVSDVVRSALRARASSGSVPVDTDGMLEEMARRFPAEGAGARVNATDRGAVKKAVRRRLGKSRP
jgi:hypothetical protein